jgi:hypothetical protein
MTTFAINQGTGHAIAVTATSSNTALHASFATVRRARFVNLSATVACIRMGPVSQTAVTTDFAIGPNESVTVEMSPTYTNLGAIMNTGTGTLFVSPVSTLE